MLICHLDQKSCLPKPWLIWKLVLIAHFIYKKSVTAITKSRDLFYLLHSCMLTLCAQSIFLFLLECLPAVSSSPLRPVLQRPWILVFESHDLMQVCGFFGGCSSLSLLAIFFPQCHIPFQWLHGALCFWLQVKEAVKHALSVGYRHIDCAAAYGNEAEIGEAFQECVGPNKVKIQELSCWLGVVPKLTAVTCEVNICGFSCWSTPAVCYLSGEGMKEGFPSS